MAAGAAPAPGPRSRGETLPSIGRRELALRDSRLTAFAVPGSAIRGAAPSVARFRPRPRRERPAGPGGGSVKPWVRAQRRPEGGRARPWGELLPFKGVNLNVTLPLRGRKRQVFRQESGRNRDFFLYRWVRRTQRGPVTFTQGHRVTKATGVASAPGTHAMATPPPSQRHSPSGGGAQAWGRGCLVTWDPLLV